MQLGKLKNLVALLAYKLLVSLLFSLMLTGCTPNSGNKEDCEYCSTSIEMVYTVYINAY